MGNCGNLTIDERRRVPKGFKAGAFLAVPCCSGLVVRQDRKGSVHNITQIGLQRCPSFPLGKPPTSEGELVPYRRSNRALWTVLLETLQNR